MVQRATLLRTIGPLSEWSDKMIPEIKHSSLSKGEVYTRIYEASLSGAYVSYLRGTRCDNEDSFFKEISASFQFPFYYGENWPATDECLCDLEWLNASKIHIMVDDFSQMFSAQASIQDKLKSKVIKYFAVMVDYWKEQNVPIEIWLNN